MVNSYVTDLLLEGLKTTEKTQHLEGKIARLEEQLTELNSKYEQATGRKAVTKKRITVPVTDTEYAKIRKAAFDAKMPHGQFMRGILTGELTVEPAALGFNR